MMKKAAALILTAGMTFCLAACGQGTPSEDVSGENASDGEDKIDYIPVFTDDKTMLSLFRQD